MESGIAEDRLGCMDTPKQRMLKAYRGIPNDRPPVAPEFAHLYPAKVLGLDLIEITRVPFHQALKQTFEQLGCEGFGLHWAYIPNPHVTRTEQEKWVDADTLETRTQITTPHGVLTCANRTGRKSTGGVVERMVKDWKRDLPAWESLAFGGDLDDMNVAHITRVWEEVGESYLLEAGLGFPFFDLIATARGFEEAVLDFFDPDFTPYLEKCRDRYRERMVEMARIVCERTPCECLYVGGSMSCASLMGPQLWRQWDKPVIRAVADEVHRHGKLIHIHFHGKSLEMVPDFVEMGIDCVCPFERPPGGDVAGLAGLKEVERQLRGHTCMKGNIHTVETLIRGRPEDVRREVREVLEAFAGNPRVAVGTGDQVGYETPEENLAAMIAAVKAAAAPQAHKKESAALQERACATVPRQCQTPRHGSRLRPSLRTVTRSRGERVLRSPRACVSPGKDERRTSNVNVQRRIGIHAVHLSSNFTSTFDVRCSMFDVRFFFSFPGPWGGWPDRWSRGCCGCALRCHAASVPAPPGFPRPCGPARTPAESR